MIDINPGLSDKNLPDIAPPTVKVLIDNSPMEADQRRLRLFYLMVISFGGLAGFELETMRQ